MPMPSLPPVSPPECPRQSICDIIMTDRTIHLNPGERLDDLQVGGCFLIQKPDTFCLGTDSVLLADFASPRRRDRAVDLGCGNGAISILMAAHQPQLQVDAVELQPDIADMARRSVQYDGLADRVRVHTCDMRHAWHALGRNLASLVVCNPPYGGQGRALPSLNPSERIARHESDLTPQDVARSADSLLKFGGRFCVVYPAHRAFEMMQAMQSCSLAPKRLRTVHSLPGKPPKILLIEAVKGGGSGLHWLPPLILYSAPNCPSPEYSRIYSHTPPLKPLS